MDSALLDKQPRWSKYEALIASDFTHNALRVAGWEFFWGLGASFALFATAVVAYLDEIGAGKTVIGLVTSLSVTACPAQVILGQMIAKQSRKKWLAYSYSLCVCPWFVYNLALLLVPIDVPRWINVPLFSACILFFMSVSVGNQALYFSFVTDCTPLNKRGLLYSLRLSAVAAALVLMAPLATWVMDNWAEPHNFLVAFAFANVFYMVSPLIILSVREHRPPTPEDQLAHGLALKRLSLQIRLTMMKMLRNLNYRMFLFSNILFSVSLALGAFVIVFAKKNLGLAGSDVIRFTIIQTVGSAAFSLLFGKLADNLGFKLVGTSQGFLLALGFSFLCLVPSVGPWQTYLLYAGFLLYSVAIGTSYMVMWNLSAELIPSENAANIVAFGNLMTMPFVLLAAPLAGLIIDFTRNFVAVFAVGSILAGISATGFQFFVNEPRLAKRCSAKCIRRI